MTHAPRSTALHWWVLALLFAIVVALRWIALGWFSVETPFFDQWDGELYALYKPAVEHTMSWQVLLAPHNEHRVLPTRLFNLALFALNDGQFDNTVVAFGSAVVYAFAVIAIALPILRRLDGAALLLGALLLTLVGVLPYGWENVVSGFQNGFYFLNVLTIAAIGVLALREPTAGNLVLAVALCLLCTVTMGSGVLVAPALILVVALRRRGGETTPRRAAAACVVIAAAGAIGVAMLRRVPGHTPLLAQNFGEFIDVFTMTAAWPVPGGTLALLFVWWPSAVMFARRLRAVDADARVDSRFDVFLLGVAAWTLVQAAAIAYSRGHMLAFVASRYADLLILGPICNVMLAVRLLRSARTDAIRGALTFAAVSMTSVLLGAVLLYGVDGAAQIRHHGAQQVEQRQILRAFLAGAGAGAFVGKSAQQTSFPNPGRLTAILNDPTVRALLPPSILPAAPPRIGSLTRAVELFRKRLPRAPP